MLNTNSCSGYKTLARKTEFRECITADNPLSEVVVDFRSRLFMYVRTVYINGPLHKKIRGLLGAINSLEDEKKRIFDAALELAKREVSMMHVNRCTYVFGSRNPCPYKEHLKRSRLPAVERRLEEFIDASQKFKSNMLDVDALKKCVLALESYIIADIDSVNSVYGGQEWLLVPEARCIKPGKGDMYESDRLCAKLANQRAVWPAKTDSRATNCPKTGTTAVLSEDLDCIALFGANMMVKEVHRGFFVYTTIDDVASTFKAVTRDNMVEKCCLMGTDYNLGLKGVGPVKVQKIDPSETSKLCKTCLSAQSIDYKKIREFFAV